MDSWSLYWVSLRCNWGIAKNKTWGIRDTLFGWMFAIWWSFGIADFMSIAWRMGLELDALMTPKHWGSWHAYSIQIYVLHRVKENATYVKYVWGCVTRSLSEHE
jgi:hypothetical protein